MQKKDADRKLELTEDAEQLADVIVYLTHRKTGERPQSPPLSSLHSPCR